MIFTQFFVFYSNFIKQNKMSSRALRKLRAETIEDDLKVKEAESEEETEEEEVKMTFTNKFSMV